MRYSYIGLIVVCAALLLLFQFQNLEVATVSLLAASISLPVSMLAFGVLVLRMPTRCRAIPPGVTRRSER